ncbi:DNA helicase-2 / ATP-dependent DNA helicase PcrA [Lutibacter agarilyticus]|uniref:DNA 3'-5' helicase n=1 Tax=Lutibacter agarilyticus TaxID=1109740 RepID=A0A238VFH2_9FLAO|nr:UvrD-helicase domain-containing protein [Lutibacter agarilyticus]SNR32914.1 DNA helicase-2 / ATP-dependent DNA helicase PcrA [Lutibacter agarilyticus]
MDKYLDNLNESQREAVVHKDGPMIIIAGAGSGKTRVLTYRIAHLMNKGVDAFNILSLTFTNKAAREMKERIGTVVGTSEAKNLWMGTFHSVFARILRSEGHHLGFPSNFTIYDSQDSVRLISSIIKEMGLDKEIYKSKQVLGRISSFKNSLITVKAYYNNPDLIEADKMAQRPKMGEIYQRYVDRCFKAGSMDFDDLLLRTNQLLSQYPAVLAKYQDRFRYILVDEYQDTNHSQYLIVKALSDRFQNICVVGDDSQSIYAFRGANIQNILNFQKNYDNVKIFKLEQNYRSSNNIVEAANSVIEKNKTKLDKEVWTDNNDGERVKIMRTITEVKEAEFVANSILDHVKENEISLSDVAILYRTNSQTRAIEDVFRHRNYNIDYVIYGGLSFYQRKEIKDTLAYLRLLINPNDEEALKRVINYPLRGIGSSTVDKLSVAANHYNKSIFEIICNLGATDINLNAGVKTKLNNFATMIQHFKIEAETKNAFEVADFVVKQTRIIKDLEKDGTPEGVSKVENIQELLNAIKNFTVEQKEKGEDDSLAFFLEDAALASDLDKEAKDDSPKVSLMTIHMSKGLEYSYVYIIGLEENLFPSAMSMNTRSELEEERRLFYVALTRAEKQAYLCYAQMRYRWGKLVDCEPSRFIQEIDEKFVEHIAPQVTEFKQTKFLNDDIFGSVPQNKIRFKKPIQRTPTNKKPVPKVEFQAPKNLKKVTSKPTTASANLFDSKVTVGNIVEHTKFGKGEVLSLEGSAANQKAEIRFASVGVKKLLLQFAKLKIIS